LTFVLPVSFAIVLDGENGHGGAEGVGVTLVEFLVPKHTLYKRRRRQRMCHISNIKRKEGIVKE
jgi:hypothetical protein